MKMARFGSSQLRFLVVGLVGLAWGSAISGPGADCTVGLPKVYTLSVSGDRLIVGTAGRRVLVWDLRNMGYVQQRRESSLKYQTRCIRAFPNKQVRAPRPRLRGL